MDKKSNKYQLGVYTLFCLLTNFLWYGIFRFVYETDILGLILSLSVLVILPAFLPTLVYMAMAKALGMQLPEKLSDSLVRGLIWLAACGIDCALFYHAYSSPAYDSDDTLGRAIIITGMAVFTAGFLVISVVTAFIHRKK